MAVRSEGPVDVGAPPAQASALPRYALEFAVRCHARQRRDSDGASFIAHPLEVARLLRDANCSAVLVAAGLLHEVGGVPQVGVTELHARFGPEVAALVQAVTDHASVHSYRQRKQVLREQVRRAGHDAALLFAADRLSKIRELPGEARRDHDRFAATPHGSRIRERMERIHEMRLEHYHESLDMLQRIVPRHPLVQELAAELGDCEIAMHEETLSAVR